MKDTPKLLALKTLIGQLGEEIYGRTERLLIFTSSPVVSLIVALVWPSFLSVYLNTNKLTVAKTALRYQANAMVLIRRPS